jgi:hypothetical protein
MQSKIGNLGKTCRYFGVSRAIFYSWRVAYDRFSQERLINKKPCSENQVVRILVERKCLTLKVARRLRSRYILEQLGYLLVYRGLSGFIRSDDDSEYIAKAVRNWLERLKVQTLFIEPDLHNIAGRSNTD